MHYYETAYIMRILWSTAKLPKGQIKMRKIYLLLMHTHTIPANFVKFFTRYEYSHSALALTQDCARTFSFGRIGVGSPLHGGFTVQEKNGEFFNKFNKTNCIIYERKVTDRQYANLESMLNIMETNSHRYKYDFVGMIPRYFNIPVKLKNRFVCSYFTAYALKKCGICNFSKDVCLIRPKDLENTDGFIPIYKGKFSEYGN